MGTIEITDLNGKGPYIYKVDHLHMHGPSEHCLDAKQEDLEMHIVHVLVDGPEGWKDYNEKLAVVGVLFRVDKKSHPFIDRIRVQDFGEIASVNLSELVDPAAGLYHYKGSLTTPPCSDVVNWQVVKDVLPISWADLEALRDIWYGSHGHGNYRECQPLGDRRVARNFD